MTDGLKAEVMNTTYIDEAEYWDAINSIACNSLTRSPETLVQIREYYNTHDPYSLGDEAESIILHTFGIRGL